MADTAEPPTLVLATRGSALALAQARRVLAQCRQAFPKRKFEIKIVKTTGDKLQTAALAGADPTATKGLFTKELEVALLNGEADLAVHSLKDLPTELPAGLTLAAVCRRADVRDVLLYRNAQALDQPPGSGVEPVAEWSPGQQPKRGFKPRLTVSGLPQGATVATSSTRRQAQLLAVRPDLKVVPIRGNVGTRLRKLWEQSEMDATILAAAGLERLQFRIMPGGQLRAQAEPEPEDAEGPAVQLNGLLATCLEPEEMLPCVGQGAIGIETREKDRKVADVCLQLDHFNTHQCVLAERAFLHAMGGGCQSPVAAYARILGHLIHLRAVSFRSGPACYAEGKAAVKDAVRLGEEIAQKLISVNA